MQVRKMKLCCTESKRDNLPLSQYAEGLLIQPPFNRISGLYDLTECPIHVTHYAPESGVFIYLGFYVIFNRSYHDE